MSAILGCYSSLNSQLLFKSAILSCYLSLQFLVAIKVCNSLLLFKSAIILRCYLSLQILGCYLGLQFWETIYAVAHSPSYTIYRINLTFAWPSIWRQSCMTFNFLIYSLTDAFFEERLFYASFLRTLCTQFKSKHFLQLSCTSHPTV